MPASLFAHRDIPGWNAPLDLERELHRLLEHFTAEDIQVVLQMRFLGERAEEDVEAA